MCSLRLYTTHWRRTLTSDCDLALPRLPCVLAGVLHSKQGMACPSDDEHSCFEPTCAGSSHESDGFSPRTSGTMMERNYIQRHLSACGDTWPTYAATACSMDPQRLRVWENNQFVLKFRRTAHALGFSYSHL